MPDRLDKNGTIIQEGDRVWIIANDPDYSNGHFKFFQKHKIYGTVYSEKDHDISWCHDNASLLNLHHSDTLSAGVKSKYPSTKLEVIPKDQYVLADQLLNDAVAFLKTQEEEIRNIPLLPNPKLNFTQRNFSFDDKNLLDTNRNYVELGYWDKSDGRNVFHVSQRAYMGSCCSFTKTTEDLQVYIPKAWLKYYGYLVYDFVSWLEFLAKCEIGFEYEFLGEVPLGSMFDNVVSTTQQIEEMKTKGTFVENHAIHIISAEAASQVNPTGKEGFYCVRLKASDDQHETYLRFICLRYLYNNFYWSIPGHAMQIKRELGEEVSHWQALLMAHLHHPYYYYYSFGSQLDLDPLKKRSAKLTIENAFNNGVNYNRHIYPFQDVNMFLTYLKTHVGPNMSIEYICDAYDRKELNEFFKSKDYIGLYLYLKSKDESKDECQWHLRRPLKVVQG